MRAYSLRLRLFAGAALWSVLALAGAGVAIVLIFTATVQRDQREDLGASLDQLTATFSQPVPAPEQTLSDPRYAKPAGGRYYQVEDLDSADVYRSRSLWDTQLKLPEPRNGEDLLASVAGPAGQTLSVLVRDITMTAPDRSLRLAVGEDVATRGHSISDFGLQIALALLAVAIGLAGAAWVVLHLGLRPVEALRRSIADIAGDRDGRARLKGSFPVEFDPLVQQMNALLDVHERTVQLTRERADDLAHGLKTPLAVIRATADRLRTSGDDDNAATLDLLSAEMSDRIDYQMRLSHLRIRTKTRTFATAIDQALIRSGAVMRKTGPGSQLFWHMTTDRVDADIDPHDLMELVGILLENAGKWARSEVSVLCRRVDDRAEIVVSDDGPGLTEDQIALLGQRGQRLDETRSGSGFGIAIAKEIIRLNGGAIAWDRGPAGGLEIRVELPTPPTDLTTG